MNIAHGHEVFLGLVLHHCGNQVVNLASAAEEHLALAILYVFLDIEGNGLGHTEVFHVFWNVDTKLFCQCEIMINGVA